jgi:hypothetical protein
VSAYEVIGDDLDIKTIGGSHIQGSLAKAKPAQSRAIDDASLSVVERQSADQNSAKARYGRWHKPPSIM